MNRVQKLKMNTVASLLNRVVIIVSGLILPRLILLYYGSEVNGLIASIKQFLNIITFLDLGIGSVVQSALYKPLVSEDKEQTSAILTAAKNYFQKVAYVLIAYVVLLVIVYPMIINNQSLSYLSTAMLIIAISISLFSQYYLGIVNELLLNADQRGYVQLTAEIVVVILNLIASAFLIIQGVPIQYVQLIASIIYLIRPVYLTYYVNKNFDITHDVEIKEDPIPQKWNGMGQHIAYTVLNSTDVTVLTLFSTLENVSIYSVYSMVVNAIRLIISSFTTGLSSFFGNLLASDEIQSLNNYFSKIEWGLHTGVVYLYGMTATLITPFVMIYTSGVTDVDYHVPIFGLVLVLSKASYSLRTPYQAMIFAAGHYKETQLSSFIEAGLNVGISLILTNTFGLVGVAFGTLISMSYRTLYLVFYLSDNIVNRPLSIFIKQILIDGATFLILFLAGMFITNMFVITSFVEWILLAIGVGIVFMLLMLIINLIFYRKMILFAMNKALKRV